MVEIPPTLLAKNTAKKSYLLKALLLLIVLLITTAVVCEILGWPFLKAPTERFLNKHLERTVRIDMPFKLKLFGGIQLDVGGLEISAPGSFNLPHFVKSKNISLGLRYTDLYRLKHSDLLRIKSLRVDQIDAQLIRHQDGESTWQFNHDETKPDSPFPTIETLIVKNGTASIFDAQKQVDLNAIFQTAEGASYASTSSVIKVQGKLLKKPIQGSLSTAGFLPIATQDSASPPIPSKGWVEYAGLRADFDGTVSDLFGKHDVKGKLLVKGPSLSLLGNLVDIVLPTTGAFSLNGFVEKNDAIWLAKVESARVGQSNIHGEFEYNPIPEKPLLTGTLGGKHLYLVDLAPSFGTKNTDGSVASPESGHVIPDRPLDFPSLNKMDAKIAVNLEHIDLGNAFSRPISPLKANLLLQDGILALTDIYAYTADGNVSGKLSIDTHASANHEAKALAPTWHINLNWKDIDLDKWLKISAERKKEAKQAGDKELPPSYLTGKLVGKTKLIGSGNSTAEMLSTLDGEVSIYIHKGTISHLVVEALGLDIAQGLGILLTGDKPLPMQCAVMNLSAKNGIATPKVALIDTPVTLVLIDGKVDLAKETLDLRLAARPKNISPFTVRSPIHVKGSFNNPDVSIEKAPIVARVLGSVALAFVNPLAAILPFIDTGSGEKSPCNESLIEFQKKS